MFEDRYLTWRFKRGSRAALQRIYEKYYAYLLTVATALVHDVGTAEDVVHDSFVKLSESRHRLNPRGNLKWYLVVCVSNRARDVLRGRRNASGPDETLSLPSQRSGPVSAAMCNEEMEIISETVKVGSIDIVEVNPILDHSNRTAELGVQLLLSALGQTIF